MIKYRVGDQSHLIDEVSEIAPGFPMIAPVSGRVTDHIKSINGYVIMGIINRHLKSIIENYLFKNP